jgi:hypothetical protein
MLGRGRVIAVVTTAEVAGSLGLAAEVGLDVLFAHSVLSGNIQELPRHAWGLAPKRVDECHIGHATVEGIDHVGVGVLITLLGEVLDVLPKGLIIF